MQSNRALGIVLLVVLALGAALIAKFVFGGSETTILPAPASANSATPGATTTATAEVGHAAAPAPAETAAVREAVAVTDKAALGLPSIIGQVVGPDERPIADAEVVCVPGVAFMPDFENLDPTDTDLFDPQSMVERMRGQVRERVAVKTDAEGRFRVHIEGTSRTVSLRVLARAHRVLDRSVPRPTDRDTDAGVLELVGGAVIAGRVLDAQGKAIQGARVSRLLAIEENLPAGMDFAIPGMAAMDDLRSGESSVTDAAGRFELAHVEAGEFTLRARHPDHPTAQKKGLSVAMGQSLSDVLVTMARGAEIRGTVVGMPDGAKGLQVMASVRSEAGSDPTGGFMGAFDPSEFMGEAGLAFGERQVSIESDGAFVLRGLEADSTYRVWVAQQGRGFAGNGICSERAEVASGTFGIELRYEAGITVTFVVVDSKLGEPIERLWVRDQLRGGGGFADMMAFAPSSTRSKTYPEGKVTVANLRPKKDQTLQLTIDALGHAQVQREGIVMPASGSLDLGTFRLDPKPVLHVAVIGDDGRPVANARVQLRREQQREASNPFARMAQAGRGQTPRSGQTDASGRCTVNALDNEAGRLEVNARGHAAYVAEIPVATQAESEHTARLLVGGSAEVTVVGPDKEPVQGATVEHRAPDGDVDRRRADAAGLARFEQLAPGSHAFRLGEDNGPMGMAFDIARRRGGGGQAEAEVEWQSVVVQNREVATLSLEKSPTARLRGIVRENGVPLVGARVAFSEGEGSDERQALTEGIMGEVMGRMGGGSKRQTKTGDDGGYELAELPAGTHRLRITHGDRAMPSQSSLTLRNGENRFDVELDMTTLRGVVRDHLGNPVDGARVTVKVVRADGGAEGAQIESMVAGMMPGFGIGGTTQKTDASGAFELRGIDPDVPLQVQATAKGFAPAVVSATVARGQLGSPVELRLGAAGRIKVSVAASGPFAAVRAKFVGGNAEEVAPVMQVLRRGKGTLEGLRPGKWQVDYHGMSDGDEPSATRTVEVVAGETATVEFQ